MKNLRTQLAVLLLSALPLLTSAHAQITPLGDAFTNTADPTTNYGANVLLDVDGASEISYIQFNLSSIPNGASVSQATLKLYVNAVTKAGSFNVDYVNGTWSEGTIDASNAPAPGSTIVSSVPITTADKNQYILINITPAVVAWLNGSQANDGLALVANSTFNASFDSKENTTTSHPAELDIVFAGGGGGGGITGVLTGNGSGLMGGGTSGTLNLSLINTCASGQILEWTGTAWACTSLSGGGTITGVTAGTDLTGGGTSGTVTLNLDTTKVPQLATPNAFTGNQSVTGNISATGSINGAAGNFTGLLTADGALLPASGTATASQGFNSQPLDIVASAYNSTAAKAQTQDFRWLAEPVNNDKSSSSGKLDLLFGANGATPAETGLSLASNGQITFATGQAFPGVGTITGITTAAGSGLTGGGTSGTLNLAMTNACAANQVLQWNGSSWICAAVGTGTVTSVGSGTGLTGGPITGSGTLSIASNTCTSGSALSGLPFTCSPFATLAANTFSGNQTITGNLTDTGNISSTGSITGQTGSFSGNSASTSAIVNVTQGGAGNGINASSTSGIAVYSSGLEGVYAYGSGTFGVYGQATSNTGTTYGVVGVVNSQSGYGVYGEGGFEGVYGTGNSYGVQGIATATTGTNYGVQGTNASPSSATGGAGVNGVSSSEYGIGVLGQAPGSALSQTAQSVLASIVGFAPNAGVWGDTNNPPDIGYGVVATADDNNAMYAANNGSAPTIAAANYSTIAGAEVFSADIPDLLGAAAAIIGDPGCGQLFMALQLGGTEGMSGCSNYTLMGDTSGNTYLNAASGEKISLRIGNGSGVMNITSGNVSVTGNLSATGTKNFRIDHPLDPANKYLFHASIESSEVLNLYSGNAVLDASGEAVVELPDWFEAINKDFRYQLTPIGAPGRDLYVAEEVSGGHFKIAGGKPGGKVSWQVTGVRNDAWEKTHPMAVEVDKGADRGHYLTPELYGQPETEAIGYMAVPQATEPVVHKRPASPRRNDVSTPPQQRTTPSLPAPPRLAPIPPAPPHPVVQLGNPEPNKK
jgi:TGF-beta propeptide